MEYYIQLIEQKVLEYLNDVSVDKRYGYNLIVSDWFYNLLSKEDRYYLKQLMKIECSGILVHSSFIKYNEILLVNMKVSTSVEDRIYKICEVSI